jgi:hypothetical protein
MNKLTFHAQTIAKKSPPGQPYILQKYKIKNGEIPRFDS